MKLLGLAYTLLLPFSGVLGDSTFLSIGDWGAAALGGYHLQNAQNCLSGMIQFQQSFQPSFVLNNGDNFYYCGIQNISDPQISTDYTSLFGKLDLDWYNALGNHDYGYNPEAQLALNQIIPQWIMDDRYYTRKIQVDQDVINVIFIDTNPCIADYRGDDPSRYDPCGTQYPTCEPYEGECLFHQNILEQDCSIQYNWLVDIVNNLNMSEWNIVVGHHPINEVNVKDFGSLIADTRIDLYINGHVHDLEHYSINGVEKYITTGAGSMVVPKKSKKYIGSKRMIYKNVITGFTSHTISGNTLTTNFWDWQGNNLYSFQVQKN